MTYPDWDPTCEVCGSATPNRACIACWDGGYAEFMEAEAARLSAVPRPTGLVIRMTQGAEGPRHDPYGYTEYDVDLPDGRRVRFHAGLGYELEVDGVEVMRGDGCAHEFQRLVGHPIDQVEYWAEDDDVGPCMGCGRESGCNGRCQE